MIEGGTGILGRAALAGGSDQASESNAPLSLVQEALLKLVRFQLAMVRQDRRTAMQAMDDVVALERKLADHIRLSGDETMSAAEMRLAEDRAAVVREKFALAAGKSGFARPASALSMQGNVEVLANEQDPPMQSEPAIELDAYEGEIPAPEPYVAPAPAQSSWLTRGLCALAAFALIAAATGTWLVGSDQLDMPAFTTLMGGD